MREVDTIKTVLNEKLAGIVSEEFVSSDLEDLIAYSRDQMSPILGSYTPDFVVMPKDVGEVQEILKIANEFEVAVYPYAFGTNTTGTALAFNHGIVLDLRRLNQIIEINEDCMASIVEPGVSWGQLNKESRKKGLRPSFPEGPYSGGPIGNFVNAPVSPYATRFSPDRVISLEVVLPNGEILRTGSSGFPTHEKLNPYFRYAYGPDLTGLFRGSLGTLGVVTKAAFQLFPVGEKEEVVSGGFDDLSNVLHAMREIEMLDISKSALISTRDMLLRCTAPDVSSLKKKDEYKRLRLDFPEWCLSIGLSGMEKQVRLYHKIIGTIIQNYQGNPFMLEGDFKKNFDDFIEGGGLKVNRMFTPEGALSWLISVVSINLIPEIRRITLSKIKELGITNPITGELLEPPVWCFPIERCRKVYFEQDLSYDPLDEIGIKKIKKAYSELNKEIIKLGGSAVVAVPSISKMLMKPYSEVLKIIKKILDPKGIMSPGL